MNISKLVRPHLITLKPYSSARDEFDGKEGTFLDANENPFSSVTGNKYNRYPDPHQREAKVKLAQLKNIRTDQIFLGNGSDEAIDLIIKIFCEPGRDNILILPPTYGMYKVCADIQQVEVLETPLTRDFQLNVQEVKNTINERTKIVWICSPNNPSGNSLDAVVIESLIREFENVIFVVDEAYNDFSESPSFIEKLSGLANLIVIQTFSKAWGMAGLRIGAAYASSDIIGYLNKIKYPYNMNQLTQQALVDALDRTEELQNFITQVKINREWLQQQLQELEITENIFPSDSNQLLVKFKNATKLFDDLIGELVITRSRTNVLLCEDCLRISIGTKPELETLLGAIKKVTS